MTQSAMRMNMAGSRPNQQDAQKRSNQQSSTARSANTPSDVIANAASQTKDEKRGVFASMKQAMAPYVEGHSHTVLYGIVGFVIAALILLAGFWPTVLLGLFAAVGVAIGRYRDGDQKTRAAMRNLLNRVRQ